MRYYGNDGFIFAWDLGVIFLGIPNWVLTGFFNFLFFSFGLKGVMEKCVGCFLVYHILRKHIDTLFLMCFNG